MSHLTMNAVAIAPLTATRFMDLHRCWCAAFTDYKIPLDIPVEELRIRLDQDGYSPEMSAAAHVGKKMVGFWLTGVRELDGKKMAYDAGTAVVPDWRGRGVSKLLAQQIESRMREFGVRRYILEVFDDNVAAIKLYQRNGFQRMRQLNAYRLKPFAIKHQSYGAVRARGASLSEAYACRDLLNYAPSWQNSWQALRAVEGSTISVVSEDEAGGCAYAVFQPAIKRFAQIGIDSVGFEREQRLMEALLGHVGHQVGALEYVEIINIPEGTQRIVELLRRCGFVDLVTLYEMVKEY